MKTNEIIRQLRISRKKTQEEVAKFLGVTSNALSMYETGKRDISIDMLKRFSDFFGVDPNTLLDSDNRKFRIRVPVLGYISAGIPIEQIEMIIDYEELPAEASRGGAEFFGFQVKGDSMEPEIRSGDIVILKKQSNCY